MTKVITRIVTVLVAVAAVVVLTPLSVHASDTTPSDTLSSNVAPPTEPPLPKPHTPIQYTVGQYLSKEADTLASGVVKLKDVLLVEDLAYIANKVSLTTDEIKYSNPSKDVTQLAKGDILTIPPVHGIVYKIQGGDTLSWIAYSYQVDVDSITSYNNVTDANVIAPDQIIIIPGAKLPPLPPPAPVYIAPSTSGNYTAPVGQPLTSPVSYSGPNRFTFGYCTWWVASKRPVPWMGDAWAWWPNARAMGYAEGQAARAGAILVETSGPVGHVAYVESVGASSFVVSEMNWNAWNVVDFRTINFGDRSIVGFIY